MSEKNIPAIYKVINTEKFLTSITDRLPASKRTEFEATRIKSMLITEIKRTPKLLECSVESILSAVALSAELGLSFNNLIGHAYLIPYGKRCQLILGYKGLMDVAYRSGNVLSITSNAVYEGDHLEYTLGTNQELVHRPKLGGKRDKIIAVYAVATLSNKEKVFELMCIDEINEIKKTYSKPRKDGSPSTWDTNFQEMARKTVVRRLMKYLPLTEGVQKTIAEDAKREAEEFDTIDGDFEVLQPEEEPQYESRADELADKL